LYFKSMPRGWMINKLDVNWLSSVWNND
jgi:hypothetical protein